jgi:hypothetical protein
VWLNTQDPVLATRYGTAAGSLIVSVQGAQGCVPTAAYLSEALESAHRKAGRSGGAKSTGIETNVGFGKAAEGVHSRPDVAMD